MQSHEAIRDIVFSQVPHEVWEFVGHMLVLGGYETFVVGGAVRDAALGIEPHDYDLEVHGISEAELLSLEGFAVAPAGHRFGVYLVRQHGTALQFDVGLPQRRVRTGEGHKGERAIIDPSLSLEQAAVRRDFTMNAVYLSLVDGEIHDPCLGLVDLEEGMLCAINADNFADDPLRVLRGFQFCSRFNLVADEQTILAAYDNFQGLATLSSDRIRNEWVKWAKGLFPAAGYDYLVDTGWVEGFEALRHLRHVQQDKQWHPEGNVCNHTYLALKDLEGRAGDPVVAFAVLLHDVGKVTTTERNEDGRWVSPGHAGVGAETVPDFFRSAGWEWDDKTPEVVQAVQALVREHMWLTSFQTEPSRTAIRRLARRLSPGTVRQWASVCISDVSGRGKRIDFDTVSDILSVAERACSLDIIDSGPEPILKGRHLIAQGKTPGPVFGEMLEYAFQAQLDGAFSTEEEGVRWLRGWLNSNDRK